MINGKDLLAIAEGEIGYREGKNKDNKYGRWYGLNHDYWCMEFVQWCYAQAGLPLPLKTASCGGLLGWYKRNQPECITKDPIPGAIVIFDWPRTKSETDHTGLFVSKTKAKITSIDGNTSNGSDSNGGYVMRRTRDLSYANPIYIVPRGLIFEEDEEVKRYNTIAEIKSDAPWAVATIEKLNEKKILQGNDSGFDLSMDMIRLLVMQDRAGVFGA